MKFHVFSFIPQRAPVKKAKKTENGETKFDLGKNRQVTVRSFKGKAYIDIRYAITFFLTFSILTEIVLLSKKMSAVWCVTVNF